MTELKLPTEYIDDAEISISELATNAHLHPEDPSTPPEIWIWASTAPLPELVFSVFDACRNRLPLPSRRAPDALEEHGNGLAIVQSLAYETSSYYTRSRLAPKPVQGKVTRFTQVVSIPWPKPEHAITEPIAAVRLLLALQSRGVSASLRRAMSALNVVIHDELVVRANVDAYHWRALPGHCTFPFIDLHETVEAVIAHVDASSECRT
ncbi:ATP-binding protein [Actinomadura adrarensis]|uniref:ATP-binding protein n=1 Tax=Actinomadura adrarensis TaxID=1819600 RepID=A0ABW3CBH8_9ACTN